MKDKIAKLKKKIRLSYYNLKYSFDRWMEKHSPIYFNTFNFLKPWREYRQVKKYFVKPYIKKQTYKQERTNKFSVLYVEIQPLWWKWKWNSVRHEYNPRIWIKFFDKWVIYYEFRSPNNADDIVYWEGILNFLYDDKAKGNLHNTYRNNLWWGGYDNEIGEYTRLTSIYPFLRDEYKEYLVRTLNDKEREEFYKFVI